MAHAPGYAGLQDTCSAPVLPTPAAFGLALAELAAQTAGTILAVDLGGATTDVFTARGDEVRRTVSANLGLSYSIGNVCSAAGWERIARWLPFALPAGDLHNRVRNKLIRPTSVPETDRDVWIEQAIAREAVRLALAHHRAAPTRLSGVRHVATMAEQLRGYDLDDDRRDEADVSLLLGSGGGLAHAPRRRQAAALLVDACRPTGITALAVDAEFLLPHVGQLKTVAPEAANDVLVGDCVTHLGACVAPVGAVTWGEPLAELELCNVLPDDVRRESQLVAGDLKCWELAEGQSAELVIRPYGEVDFGAGPGEIVEAQVTGGAAGVVCDGRGHDLLWPEAELQRRELLQSWYIAYGLIEAGEP
jgi:hypothetical protein